MDEILRAFIVAGQGVVDAVLSFSPGAIVNALVDGTRLVVGSFGDAGQHVVDGIVAAQQTLATALATQPSTTAATTLSAKVTSPEVTDVPDLGRKTATLSISPPVDPTHPTTKTPVEKKSPKPSRAKDLTAAASNKPDDPRAESAKPDTGKKPKHERKKADKDSAASAATP